MKLIKINLKSATGNKGILDFKSQAILLNQLKNVIPKVR